MSYLLYFELFLQLGVWNAPQCPTDLIYEKVDRLVKRHKVNSDYKKTIKETNCCYIVQYWPKDTMVLGGGIKAIICKQGYEVTNYVLYQ